QELLGVLASLANAFALIAEPSAGLLHQIVVHAQVQQVTFAGDAFAVHDVELGLAKGRGRLVLYHFDLGARAHDGIAIFDGCDTANINANTRVELQRASAGRGFRIAEHHANLLADLVDEHQASI